MASTNAGCQRNFESRSKRTQDLTQSQAVQQLFRGQQFALLDELPIHQRNHRPPAAESDGADFEEGREEAHQGDALAVR